MNRPASNPQSDAPALAPGPKPAAVSPLVPLWLALVVAALALGGAFAWLFPGPTVERVAPRMRFTDVTDASGLRFSQRPDDETSPTTISGAVAVLDFNNDGAPDLFFVNGAPWPWETSLAKDVTRSTCALFRNDGHGQFTDVTAWAGLNVELQGMMAAAGDFDGDGLVDLFVTCVGQNHLFRNRGGGRFEDVTEQAGVGGEQNTWSTGAAWIDIDGDGRLDLVVAHYARWPQEVGLASAFMVAAVGRSYGAPAGFLSAFPSVYRNLGDGRFALVPKSAGLRDIDPQTGLPVAKPLALIPVDANGDGRPDLLFSYHTSAPALFLNQGDGTFRKWTVRRDDRHEGASAELAGSIALPIAAQNGDPRFAAFQSFAASAERKSDDDRLRLPAKFGIVAFDCNLDGRLEILSGEGRAEADINRFEAGRAFAAPPRVFWPDDAQWAAVNGGAWAAPLVARGIAVADFDGDGDLDVVIAQHGGPPRLLRNDQRLGRPWLRVQLIATRSAPGAGGARVEVYTPRQMLVQTAMPAMGFMAQSESTLTFGLGEDARVRRVVVRWPSGLRQEVGVDAINRTLTIRER